MRSTRRTALVAILTVLITVVSWPATRGLVRLMDQHLLGERLMDSWTRVRGHEDWAEAARLERKQDFRWRLSAGAPLPIAHALGEAEVTAANTLDALRRSQAKGFRVFEADFWLQSGAVRCYHGPEAPPPLQPDDCRFENVLEALPADAWLVLDIKTDFQATASQILKIAQEKGRLSRLVFQLYAPEHISLFNDWQREHPEIPGPIITAYLSHRAVSHIAAHAKRVGVEVLTVPLARVPAYHDRPEGLALFVHPLHDCPGVEQALSAGATGLYTLNSLDCLKFKNL